MAPRLLQNKGLLAYHAFDLLRTTVFTLFLLRWARVTMRQLRGRGAMGTLQEFYAFLRRRAYGLLFRLPSVRRQIHEQVEQATVSLETKLATIEPNVPRYLQLPLEGISADKVREQMAQLSDMKHTKWEEGMVSGAVYHGKQEMIDLQLDAYGRFTVSNPIHPDVFPGVRKMEAEVVAMVLRLFNAPEEGAGVTTSGGTESILLACLSARQKARAERGVTEPEMILPETAHTAFHKAGEYFGIKIHLVSCPAPSHKVHVPSVKRLINSNTVLLVGSAPNFPHGIIDDITSLSRLAHRHSLPMHVDCCLGSFLVPMLGKAGFPTEPFDFRLPGVTSISCDTHKYGFAPKGNSTLLYRNPQLRTYQYFVSPDWSGGVYASPNMAGSRPGALIAGCWASMMNMGEDGYIRSCHSIVGAAKTFEAAIREDPEFSSELAVVGRPMVSVVAFTAHDLNIYDVSDGMSAKGWHLNALQNPPAIHVAFTIPIVPHVDRLIADLKAVLDTEREKERVRIASGSGKKGASKGDTAALYGVAGSLPDKRIVVQLAQKFLDTLYKT